MAQAPAGGCQEAAGSPHSSAGRSTPQPAAECIAQGGPVYLLFTRFFLIEVKPTTSLNQGRFFSALPSCQAAPPPPPAIPRTIPLVSKPARLAMIFLVLCSIRLCCGPRFCVLLAPPPPPPLPLSVFTLIPMARLARPNQASRQKLQMFYSLCCPLPANVRKYGLHCKATGEFRRSYNSRCCCAPCCSLPVKLNEASLQSQRKGAKRMRTSPTSAKSWPNL